MPYDVVMDRADITVAVDVTGDTKRRPGVRVPRTLAAVTGATQILFHSITREKLKSMAPDILIGPRSARFGALDYFKMRGHFGRRGACQGSAENASCLKLLLRPS